MNTRLLDTKGIRMVLLANLLVGGVIVSHGTMASDWLAIMAFLSSLRPRITRELSLAYAQYPIDYTVSSSCTDSRAP